MVSGMWKLEEATAGHPSLRIGTLRHANGSIRLLAPRCCMLYEKCEKAFRGPKQRERYEAQPLERILTGSEDGALPFLASSNCIEAPR